MKIEHSKTYSFEIKNLSFGDLSMEELIENFKDGRCCSWFMEPQLVKWFPQLTRVKGNKDHDHIDDHIKNIEIENKKLDKLSRMRELENWLDYLNLE